MSKPLTITFEESSLGVVKIKGDPSMAEVAMKLAGGHGLTMAEAYFASAMTHLSKVAKQNKLSIKAPR